MPIWPATVPDAVIVRGTNTRVTCLCADVFLIFSEAKLAVHRTKSYTFVQYWTANIAFMWHLFAHCAELTVQTCSVVNSLVAKLSFWLTCNLVEVTVQTSWSMFPTNPFTPSLPINRNDEEPFSLPVPQLFPIFRPSFYTAPLDSRHSLDLSQFIRPV